MVFVIFFFNLFFCFLAIALIVNATINLGTLTFSEAYGLAIIFPSLTQWLLMVHRFVFVFLLFLVLIGFLLLRRC